jgi:hypothetical protein
VNKIQVVQNQLMNGNCPGALSQLNLMLAMMTGKVCDPGDQVTLSALINNLIATITAAQAAGCC